MNSKFFTAAFITVLSFSSFGTSKTTFQGKAKFTSTKPNILTSLRRDGMRMRAFDYAFKDCKAVSSSCTSDLLGETANTTVTLGLSGRLEGITTSMSAKSLDSELQNNSYESSETLITSRYQKAYAASGALDLAGLRFNALKEALEKCSSLHDQCEIVETKIVGRPNQVTKALFGTIYSTSEAVVRGWDKVER